MEREILENGYCLNFKFFLELIDFIEGIDDLVIIGFGFMIGRFSVFIVEFILFV